MKTVLLVGHGRAGKDEGLRYLSEITGLANAGTTSKYLAKYVSVRLKCGVQVAYDTRHDNRDTWYQIGKAIRENDPGVLLCEALKHGPLTGGVRDLEEIEAARSRNLVDLVVWIENNRVPDDPTVMFTSGHCDVVIQNNGTLEEYHNKLYRLARFAGIAKEPPLGKEDTAAT